MPLVGVAIAFVASKVLDYFVTEGIGTVDKAASARVRALLGRDPAKLAMQVALARTEARFADRYPQWHDALFDEVFWLGLRRVYSPAR